MLIWLSPDPLKSLLSFEQIAEESLNEFYC